VFEDTETAELHIHANVYIVYKTTVVIVPADQVNKLYIYYITTVFTQKRKHTRPQYIISPRANFDSEAKRKVSTPKRKVVDL